MNISKLKRETCTYPPEEGFQVSQQQKKVSYAFVVPIECLHCMIDKREDLVQERFWDGYFCPWDNVLLSNIESSENMNSCFTDFGRVNFSANIPLPMSDRVNCISTCAKDRLNTKTDSNTIQHTHGLPCALVLISSQDAIAWLLGQM